MTAFIGCLKQLDSRLGIAKAMSEAVARLDLKTVKIAVADIKPFAIIFLCKITVEIAVVHGKRDVFIVDWPG